MPTRQAQASWSGGLAKGKGEMKVESGAFEGPFSFGTRFEDQQGTNPEELIGASLAGCFSMALSKAIGDNGQEPKQIDTSAKVTLDKTDGGFAISKILLETKAQVPGLDEDTFQKLASQTKEGCPVSKALKGTEIKLEATLS